MNLSDFVEPGDTYINFSTGERTTMDPEPRQYQGEDDAVIEYATDCWLQNPAGEKVSLAGYHSPDMLVTHSVCGASDLVDGALSPMNSAYGIERCDECAVFESDFDAAQAVAEKIGGDLTIWYYPSPKEKQ